MKVIVLTGPSSSGKTITLKIVYEYLKEINEEETNSFHYLDSAKKDFYDVLVIKGIIVVIFTQGDYINKGAGRKTVLELLEEAENEGKVRNGRPVIVVCAYSQDTESDRNCKFFEILKSKYQIETINKTDSGRGLRVNNPKCVNANTNDSDEIKNAFDKLLKESQHEQHD